MSNDSNMYDVHIYAVTRVKVINVPGTSQQDAIETARKNTELDQLLQLEGPGNPNAKCSIDHAEFAEETPYYLVDEHGDVEHEHSQFYDELPSGLVSGGFTANTSLEIMRAIHQMNQQTADHADVRARTHEILELVDKYVNRGESEHDLADKQIQTEQDLLGRVREMADLSVPAPQFR